MRGNCRQAVAGWPWSGSPRTPVRWRACGRARRAFQEPERAATARAQSCRAPGARVRVRITVAATGRAVRVSPQPHVAMRPETLTCPDGCRLGVGPRDAPTSPARRKRRGSPIVVMKLIAVRRPAPGVVLSSRRTSSRRATRRARRRSCRFCVCTVRHGSSRLPITAAARRVARPLLTHRSLEGAALARAEHHAKRLERAAGPVDQPGADPDEVVPRRQERPQPVRLNRSDGNGPVPVRADELREAGGGVALGLAGL